MIPVVTMTALLWRVTGVEVQSRYSPGIVAPVTAALILEKNRTCRRSPGRCCFCPSILPFRSSRRWPATATAVALPPLPNHAIAQVAGVILAPALEASGSRQRTDVIAAAIAWRSVRPATAMGVDTTREE